MTERKRNITLTFRVDEEENDIIRYKMKLAGIPSLRMYLSRMAIYGYVIELDMTDINEYSVQIARIGNNLNQVTRKLHETGNLYKEDIQELKDEFRRANDYLSRYLDIYEKAIDLPATKVPKNEKQKRKESPSEKISTSEEDSQSNPKESQENLSKKSPPVEETAPPKPQKRKASPSKKNPSKQEDVPSEPPKKDESPSKKILPTQSEVPPEPRKTEESPSKEIPPTQEQTPPEPPKEDVSSTEKTPPKKSVLDFLSKSKNKTD